MPTVGQAITMQILMFQSKQKMFLAPTGASYNIVTRKHIFGKQEQTKLGKIASKITKKTEKIKKSKQKKIYRKSHQFFFFPGL